MSRLDQTVKPDGVEDAENGTGVLIEQEHLELFMALWEFAKLPSYEYIQERLAWAKDT
jgi:hypothetical protein